MADTTYKFSIECRDGYPIPPLEVCIDRYVEAARLTNPLVRCIGISVNSSNLSDADYARRRAAIEAETGLPGADPIREGVEKLTASLEDS